MELKKKLKRARPAWWDGMLSVTATRQPCKVHADDSSPMSVPSVTTLS